LAGDAICLASQALFPASATIGALTLLPRAAANPPPVTRPLGLVAIPLALCCASALADPGYYVVTVYDNPGVRTVDFRYWTFGHPGSPTVTWPELGLGLNVGGRWYTEFLASFVGSADFATRLSTLNWQNDVLLTQGQYPCDVAIHSLVVRPQNPASGALLEFGPVLQTDVGRTQINFNLIFERGFGELSSHPTQMKYQWQLRHRWKPWLHVGLQGFGELGPWNDWSARDAQSHRIGPALFGKIAVGGGSLGWQAAYLAGSVYSVNGNMFSMRVTYDF
jgi:hypothetical protein